MGTNAENAVTAAESDLAQKEAIAAVKLTEKNDAQGNHDAEIDSLNDEQAMIQQVITILEDLLVRQGEVNWIQCASEGAICHCNGNVRYGVDDRWNEQAAVGNI